MKRNLRTLAVAAIAVIPWLPALAAGGGVASGGKAGSTSARTAKSSRLSQHCEVRSVRSFGGFRSFGQFGSTRVDGPSFLIVDAVPAEAQVFLDGRPVGSAAELLARALPVAPGHHVVQVVAPGFTSQNVRVVADPNFSTRLRISLFRE
jgi:hypothetical protein